VKRTSEFHTEEWERTHSFKVTYAFKERRVLMIRQRLKTVLAAGAACIFLCACGQNSDVTKETTVKFEQDGTITNTIIENFDETLYSADNLQSMMIDEVSSFNSTTGGKSISIDKVEVSEGKVEVVLSYAGASVYEAFNEVTCFYGTMKEFYDAGIEKDGIAFHTRNGDVYGMEELLKMEDERIVVLEKSKVEGTIKVDTPSKILYASDNVEFLSNKSVRISADTEDLVYIIIKGQ